MNSMLKHLEKVITNCCQKSVTVIKIKKDFWQSLDPNKTQFRYIHRPTVPGTYYYKLWAVYVDDIFSEWIYGDIDYAALENPKIKASALNGSSIKVSWNKIKNADGYYIYKTVKSTRRPLSEVDNRIGEYY